jgi:hypothetical protein
MARDVAQVANYQLWNSPPTLGLLNAAVPLLLDCWTTHVANPAVPETGELATQAYNGLGGLTTAAVVKALDLSKALGGLAAATESLWSVLEEAARRRSDLAVSAALMTCLSRLSAINPVWARRRLVPLLASADPNRRLAAWTGFSLGHLTAEPTVREPIASLFLSYLRHRPVRPIPSVERMADKAIELGFGPIAPVADGHGWICRFIEWAPQQLLDRAASQLAIRVRSCATAGAWTPEEVDRWFLPLLHWRAKSSRPISSVELSSYMRIALLSPERFEHAVVALEALPSCPLGRHPGIVYDLADEALAPGPAARLLRLILDGTSPGDLGYSRQFGELLRKIAGAGTDRGLVIQLLNRCCQLGQTRLALEVWDQFLGTPG